MRILTLLFTTLLCVQLFGQEKFPDGTPIPEWFRKNETVRIDALGKSMFLPIIVY